MRDLAHLRGLYGITDASLCPDDASLTRAVEAALLGGMRVLQYRDKNFSAEVKLRQALALRTLCETHKALFIINDDIELARQCEAHGVHLGREDGAISLARRQLGDGVIIGSSCYDRLELALEAQDQGADYIAFGRFHVSSTKPDAVQAPLDLLDQARDRLTVPICAIGGITTDNGAELVQRGAHMLAVINGLFAAPDIRQRAREFSRFFV
jgi:thiamine-phosphate pyrophosphorylase